MNLRRLSPAIVALAMSISAQNADVKILSINDMHGHIEMMPRLAFVIDSVRALHHDVVLLAGGDNRTGEPYNDKHPVPNTPMIEMMNALHFDASAMGNHECDGGQRAFAYTVDHSEFPYLVCNAFADDSLGIHTTPYTMIDIGEDMRMGILGVIQLGKNGIPDAAVRNMAGISFSDPIDEIANYGWMRDSCNVWVLLSHLGYKADLVAADRYPQLDLIVGGHSHTFAPGEWHNGVMITQAQKYVNYLNEIDIHVRDGKVADITCRPIHIPSATGEDAAMARMLRGYYESNPSLAAVVTTIADPITDVATLGTLVAEAYAARADIDVALVNAGSVRSQLPLVGDLTVGDIYRLDPFDNELISVEVTGHDLRRAIVELAALEPNYGYGFTAGVTYTIDTDSDDTLPVIRRPDGSEIDYDAVYRLGLSSYLSERLPAVLNRPMHSVGVTCGKALIDYLEHCPAPQ